MSESGVGADHLGYSDGGDGVDHHVDSDLHQVVWPDGRTALHWNTRTDGVFGGQIRNRIMMEAGADVDLQDEDGETILHWAAGNAHNDVLTRLIVMGADVNHQNRAGQTPLFRAAKRGHTAIVRIMMESGADPGIPDNNGVTPSHVASDEIVR